MATEAAGIGDEIETWVQARLGKVTASRVADVIAKTKTGWSAKRESYMIELMAERFTGMRAEPFLSAAMLWGVETEHAAREAYQRFADAPVQKVWFIEHPYIPMAGASPDGLVGDEGLLEIKCPNTATHVHTLLSRTVPEKHVAQMQWQLACTERKWCDFVSFDPRMPDGLRLAVIRTHRVPEIIEQMEALVIQFLRELDAAIERIEGGHLESQDLPDEAYSPIRLTPRAK